MSILAVIGTRPEAIKQAPVIDALAGRGLMPVIIRTGQHPGLDLRDHGLGDYPAIELDCRPDGDPIAYAARVAQVMTPLCREAELVIVQGDTSSALGGALAGFAAATPVAHVEAGLRSFDPAMPWPEEGNRVAIDARAELLFSPTATSAANLIAERVPGMIHVTGNTAIDALAKITSLPAAVLQPAPATPRILVTCHRRENWGDAFLPIARALLDLARGPDLLIDVLLHPNPQVAGLMQELLGEQPAIHLLPPMDHAGMIAAMRRSTILLSDSGGVQEEASALGIPLLVLREKTERPEAIETGNMKLVGTGTGPIVAEVRRLLDDPLERARMAVPALPYGDGTAGERIAAIVEDWLVARGRIERRLTA